ncbi:MAG TPA: TlpA disulfide reductase family protein [Candidatus Baltobacteraceae bacterium]|jgi:thiol-disulfide isomerase/thioredoxin
MIRKLLVLAVAALCTVPVAAAAPPRPGQPAPTFDIRTLDNKPVKLTKLHGKAVYLDFFASWCAPCREETPEIIKLSKQYQKRGLAVIGLDDNESKDRAQGFSDQFKVPFPVAVADQKLLDSYGVIALPVHVFIDRNGQIKLYRLGEMSNKEIEDAINSIL